MNILIVDSFHATCIPVLVKSMTLIFARLFFKHLGNMEKCFGKVTHPPPPLPPPLEKIGRMPVFTYHNNNAFIVIGPQPSSMMNKNMPKCSECMNMPKDPVYQSECGHFFCKSCKKLLNEKTMICPACKQENLFRGKQPEGHMTWRSESYSSLPGYEKFGTILLTFNFDSGFQGMVNFVGVVICMYFD